MMVLDLRPFDVVEAWALTSYLLMLPNLFQLFWVSQNSFENPDKFENLKIFVYSS